MIFLHRKLFLIVAYMANRNNMSAKIINSLVLPKVVCMGVTAAAQRYEALAHDFFVLLQPTRWKIIGVLKQSGESLYIKEIATKVGEDWKVVSFHLSALAEAGFVEGEFRSIQRPSSNPGLGRAGKFYHVTRKVDDVLSRLDELHL
jgi:DNA-binding transcriptional ArsR family regulator